MTVVVTGSTLTLAELIAVARREVRVELDPRAADRMQACRQVMERALTSNEAVYGLTTGVAELKRVRVSADEVERFNTDLIRTHRIAHGPPFPREVVRAAMLRLLNSFASGYPGVRTELGHALVDALNRNVAPAVRSLGSVGQSDLGPNADLATELFGRVALAPGEALALLNHNAFSTAAAALTIADALHLASVLTLAGALSLEGFAGNLSIIQPAVTASRPFRGVQAAITELGAYLEGSYLWEPGTARNLQDPLSFRSLPQTLGALRDVLDFTSAQLAIELNASQGNPIVAREADQVIAVANFDAVALSAALDFVRIAFAPALTSCAERTLKLLAAPWSGLPSGLNPQGGAGLGLSELGVVLQAAVAEARALARPVSYEVVSSAKAEGIEDRISMAPLSARRLEEMVALGRRAAAIEIVVAAQAVEVRGVSPLGKGTAEAVRMIREQVPYLRSAADFPSDLDAAVAMVSEIDLAGPLRSVPAG